MSLDQGFPRAFRLMVEGKEEAFWGWNGVAGSMDKWTKEEASEERSLSGGGKRAECGCSKFRATKTFESCSATYLISLSDSHFFCL